MDLKEGKHHTSKVIRVSCDENLSESSINENETEFMKVAVNNVNRMDEDWEFLDKADNGRKINNNKHCPSEDIVNRIQTLTTDDLLSDNCPPELAVCIEKRSEESETQNIIEDILCKNGKEKNKLKKDDINNVISDHTAGVTSHSNVSENNIVNPIQGGFPIEPVKENQLSGVDENIRLPDYLKYEQFDILLVYAEDDRDDAYKMKLLMEKFFILDDGKPVKISFFDDNSNLSTLVQDKFKHMELAIARSTLYFFYMSKAFCTDRWAEMQRNEILQDSIHDPEKRWSVVPLHQPSDERDYDIPFGLRALKGINMGRLFKQEKGRDRKILKYLTEEEIDNVKAEELDGFFLRNNQKMFEEKKALRDDREKNDIRLREQFLRREGHKKILEEAKRNQQDKLEQKKFETEVRLFSEALNDSKFTAEQALRNMQRPSFPVNVPVTMDSGYFSNPGGGNSQFNSLHHQEHSSTAGHQPHAQQWVQQPQPLVNHYITNITVKDSTGVNIGDKNQLSQTTSDSVEDDNPDGEDESEEPEIVRGPVGNIPPQPKRPPPPPPQRHTPHQLHTGDPNADRMHQNLGVAGAPTRTTILENLGPSSRIMQHPSLMANSIINRSSNFHSQGSGESMPQQYPPGCYSMPTFYPGGEMAGYQVTSYLNQPRYPRSTEPRASNMGNQQSHRETSIVTMDKGPTTLSPQQGRSPSSSWASSDGNSNVANGQQTLVKTVEPTDETPLKRTAPPTVHQQATGMPSYNPSLYGPQGLVDWCKDFNIQARDVQQQPLQNPQLHESHSMPVLHSQYGMGWPPGYPNNVPYAGAPYPAFVPNMPYGVPHPQYVPIMTVSQQVTPQSPMGYPPPRVTYMYGHPVPMMRHQHSDPTFGHQVHVAHPGLVHQMSAPSSVDSELHTLQEGAGDYRRYVREQQASAPLRSCGPQGMSYQDKPTSDS